MLTFSKTLRCSNWKILNKDAYLAYFLRIFIHASAADSNYIRLGHTTHRYLKCGKKKLAGAHIGAQDQKTKQINAKNVNIVTKTLYLHVYVNRTTVIDHIAYVRPITCNFWPVLFQTMCLFLLFHLNAYIPISQLTLHRTYELTKPKSTGALTADQQTIRQQYGDWYTGRWWVDCYIWYSEEGPGRAAPPPSPLLAVPNATAHLSTVGIST